MSFPRRYARTRRFTLGIPRDMTVAAGGDRVLFLRAAGPEDPLTELWQWTPGGGEERLLSPREVRPRGDDGELPHAERLRRERQRESAEGITAYATDRAGACVVTSLDGRVLTLEVETGVVSVERVAEGAFDPRLDLAGERIAVVVDGSLQVLPRGGEPRVVAREEGVAWGVADFVAAEEMHRFRGHWWSPDGRRLAACRVDEEAVPTWFISDPADPTAAPQEHRYPAAGTANPEVGLSIFDVEGYGRVDVRWDHDRFPYLARVSWAPERPLTLLVQDRHQLTWQILTVDEETGATTLVQQRHDPGWLELVDGVPAWTGDGKLVTVADRDELGQGGTRCVVVADSPVTPAGLQVESVLTVEGSAVWFRAFDGPFDLPVWKLQLESGELTKVGPEQGVGDAVIRDGTLVLRSDRVSSPPTVSIHRGGGEQAELEVQTLDPGVEPAAEFLRLGPHELPSALLRPTDWKGDGPLPVLLSPYGGPGLARARRAVRDRGRLLEAQWFADQGFAVLVVDNRGMPGVNVQFEKAVSGDLATRALSDQVAAVEALADHEPDVDLDRVAIRGWSFGGFLAALAVLRRPDVFRAGIAGAPVTDWRLYDTHYTERYLGLPDENPASYRVSSLVDDDGLVDAAPWDDGQRLLVIHGLADDNVVAAHSLRLSQALLADGRDHEFLPLPQVTHMTPQEAVAENLLLAQLRFLRRTLRLG
ncbi:MAG: prolyl oligopeptidase family serine peptidase [Nitriliruptorales bacterium]|nr:prolyl oligopeptidase family serine peptidase [Nitriliruptorales bacterium]